MRHRYAYPIEIEVDVDGATIVSFPDLPEALTGDAYRAQALALAADCLEEALAGRITDREPLPQPSPAHGRPLVAPGALIAAKAALYEALGAEGMTKTALARRLGCGENEVRRLLDPRYNSGIGRVEEALRILGKRLFVEAHDVA